MINQAKNFIKNITVNLNNDEKPSVEVDQEITLPLKRKPKRHQKKRKPIRTMFETKVYLDDHHKEILRQLFIDHNKLATLAYDLVAKYPNMHILEIKDRMYRLAREEKMEHIIDSVLNSDVHYAKKGKKKDPKRFFLNFNEKSLSNKRFTVSNSGGEMILAGVNLLLILEDRISNVPKDKKFNLNLITEDLEYLDDLTLSLFYITRKNEEETKQMLNSH